MHPSRKKFGYDERLSPFRYPGGKAFLYERILSSLANMGSDAPAYVEPYAGGAGAALLLLSEGIVSKIHLNDADLCVYAAWTAVLRHTDRFIEAVESRPVDMSTWRKSKSLVDEASADTDQFELGFATYFLNRTNRSGILRGAGPIGGYKQEGIWKIDARYYRGSMVSRLKRLGRLADKIELSNEDGLAFLTKCSTTLDNSKTFYFIDPPYVKAGSRLYLNTMTDESHHALAAFLKGNHLWNWLLTYDDHELIQTAYSDFGYDRIEIPYSLQNKRRELEIIVQRLADGQRAVHA